MQFGLLLSGERNVAPLGVGKSLLLATIGFCRRLGHGHCRTISLLRLSVLGDALLDPGIVFPAAFCQFIGFLLFFLLLALGFLLLTLQGGVDGRNIGGFCDCRIDFSYRRMELGSLPSSHDPLGGRILAK